MDSLCSEINKKFYQKACDAVYENMDTKRQRLYSPEMQSISVMSTNEECSPIQVLCLVRWRALSRPKHSRKISLNQSRQERPSQRESWRSHWQPTKSWPKLKRTRPSPHRRLPSYIAARWQDDAYITTKVRAEGLKPSQGNLAVILADSDKGPSKGPLRHFFERYPELEEMRLAEEEVIGAT